MLIVFLVADSLVSRLILLFSNTHVPFKLQLLVGRSHPLIPEMIPTTSHPGWLLKIWIRIL